MGCILYELATRRKAFDSDWSVLLYLSSQKNIDKIPDNSFDVHSIEIITKHIVNMLQISASDRPSSSVLSTELSQERHLMQVNAHTLSSSTTVPEMSDDSEQIQSMVQNHHDIIDNTNNSTPIVPLHLQGVSLYSAAEKGDIEAVKILLDAKEDVNAQGGFYGNALQVASANGHEAAVRLLLEAGADVESKDNTYGQTPLSWAAEMGHLDVVKWLVLEAGADVESKDRESGRTPLSWAARNGHLEVVNLLVQEAGTDVESKDQQGRTPLRCAAENGHLEIVKFLVQAGAKVESKDNDGWTPLTCAAANGQLDVAKWLVRQAGADVDSKDYKWLTPLSWAAWNGHLEAVKWLVGEAGANVELKDRAYGRTPLSWAAVNGHLEAVRWLVNEAGADITSKDKDGKTVLDLAVASAADESKQPWETKGQWERRWDGARAVVVLLKGRAPGGEQGMKPQ